MALVNFSKEAIFPHAQRSTARIGTLHTQSDATSCSHQKEKGKPQHPKAGILFSFFLFFFLFFFFFFFFLKDPRGKGRKFPKGKAKKTLANTKIIARERPPKEKNPKTLKLKGLP
jgi:hypothetical protein